MNFKILIWKKWIHIHSLYGFGLGKRAANIEEDTSTTAPIDHSNYDGYDRSKFSSKFYREMIRKWINYHLQYIFFFSFFRYLVRASRGALSAGLGKRLLQEENVERRSGSQRYNFGLGR